jgi:hypothetical protein
MASSRGHRICTRGLGDGHRGRAGLAAGAWQWGSQADVHPAVVPEVLAEVDVEPLHCGAGRQDLGVFRVLLDQAFEKSDSEGLPSHANINSAFSDQSPTNRCISMNDMII